LSAIETLGEGKIVSAPKVMTLNNKKAIIKQGREIPYSVIGADGQVNTEFKEVDLLLEVVPHVTPDDRVTLRVLITKDEIAEFSVDGVPSLSTKRAETELLVNDGETIVIGGILLSNEQKTVDSVPGLGKVPVLKWLFKRDFNTNRKEELLIFLTPRIMRLEQKTI
jgi:type IV pilus assembly protein PilQ